MKLKNIFAVLVFLFSISLLASSCGGGGGGGASSTEEPSSLTIANTCTAATFDVYVNNVYGATLAPTQSKTGSVVPGTYAIKLCITNTSTCDTINVYVPVNTHYTAAIC